MNRLIRAPLLMIAAVLLVLGWKLPSSEAKARARVNEQYVCLWDHLVDTRNLTQSRLEALAVQELPYRAFDISAQVGESSSRNHVCGLRFGSFETSLLLSDSNGEAIAWSTPRLASEPSLPTERIGLPSVLERMSTITFYETTPIRIDTLPLFLTVGISVDKATYLEGSQDGWKIVEWRAEADDERKLENKSHGGRPVLSFGLAGPCWRRVPEQLAWLLTHLVFALLILFLLLAPIRPVVTPIWAIPSALVTNFILNYRSLEMSPSGSTFFSYLNNHDLWISLLTIFILSIGRLCARSSSPTRIAAERDGIGILIVGLCFAGVLLQKSATLASLIISLIAFLFAYWTSLNTTKWSCAKPFKLGLLSIFVATSIGFLQAQIREVSLIANSADFLLQPPTQQEQRYLIGDLQSYFETIGDGFVAINHGEEPSFAAWTGSPLAVLPGRSALRLESPVDPASTYVNGLVTKDNGTFDSPELPAPWTDTLLYGRAQSAGAPWTSAQFWYQSEPGFRYDRTNPGAIIEIEARNINEQKDIDESRRLREQQSFFQTIGMGELPQVSERTLQIDDWIFVIPAPSLSWLSAIERIGTDFLEEATVVGPGCLSWLLLINFSGLITVMQRIGAAILASYLLRIVGTFIGLTFLPIVVTSVSLFVDFQERLQEERLERARTAMDTARSLLLDYLEGLEPGFLVETKVNQSLLGWISTLVKERVSLYWGSLYYSSSNPELFSSGVFSRRIPADVFVQLTEPGSNRPVHVLKEWNGSLLVFARLDHPGLSSIQRPLFMSLIVPADLDRREAIIAMGRRTILLSLLLIFGLIWAARHLAKALTEPILALIRQTERIAAGVQADRISPKVSELMPLADAIETMKVKIATNLQLLQSERDFIRRVIDNFDAAIFLLDRDHKLIFMNRTAQSWFGRDLHDISLELFDLLLKDEDQIQISEGSRVKSSHRLAIGQGDRESDLEMLWIPIERSDGQHLLILSDVTETLRAQRLLTYVELSSIVAHEIKNPLTPIRLSAEHLLYVMDDSPDNLREAITVCAANILRQVEALRELSTEFSLLGRLSQVAKTVGPLHDVILSILEDYRVHIDTGKLTIEYHSSSSMFAPVEHDPKLMSRALRNIVENAHAAIENNEPGKGRIFIKSSQDNGRLLLAFRDNGPGVDPALLPKIFEPYFSTRVAGTGLGLAITRVIIHEHNGTITGRNLELGGFEITISLPIYEAIKSNISP